MPTRAREDSIMPQARSRSTLRHVILSVGLVLLMGAVSGCMSLPIEGGKETALSDSKDSQNAVAALSQEISPRGPGVVFLSPQDAAVDALAYCYLTSRSHTLDVRRAAGGAIHAVEGGFSYDEPSLASNNARARLRYTMGRSDVAHFNYYPEQSFTRRAVDREQRRVVEKLDPAHRPLYTLSADRYLRVYEAGPKGHETLARVNPLQSRISHVVALSMKADGLAHDNVPSEVDPKIR